MRGVCASFSTPLSEPGEKQVRSRSESGRSGTHDAIVDEALFEQVQRRRFTGRTPRAAPTARGALSGRIRCGRCIRPLWSDVANSGRPLYREQHGQPCDTGGRSMQADVIDEQIGTIFGAIELRPDLRDAVLFEATREHGSVDLKALRARRQRLARAYADGAFSDSEYEARMQEIHRQIDMAAPTKVSAVRQTADLLENLPQVWAEAAYDERRELLASLLHHVYVDVDAKRVAAIAPTAAFRSLLEQAIRAVPGAPVLLVAPMPAVQKQQAPHAPLATVRETAQISSNLVGVVETGEN